MKTKFVLTALLVFALSSAAAYAEIWRVDNNIGSSGDFTTAQDAHDDAGDGDTLYFIGSPTSYGSLTMTKKLTIYGPGYFLDENPDTQQNKNSATIGQLNFEEGSENSYVSGMTISSNLNINTNDITLQRNHILCIATTSSISKYHNYAKFYSGISFLFNLCFK